MPTTAQEDREQLPVTSVAASYDCVSIAQPFARLYRVAKGLLFATMMLLATMVYSQAYWFAGAGASLEPSEELLGVNLRGYYGPNEVFCFGPEISIFPYQEVSEEEELSLIDLNVNAHYVFEIAHGLGLYPIGGINYSIENTRGTVSGNTEEARISALGLNYGAGLHFNLNKVFVYAEYKGVIGELSAPFITAGIIFDLSKNESEH